MLSAILMLIGVSFALSLALTFLARAYGRRRLLLDSAGAAGQRKVRRAVPNIGGVAIFWAIAGPMLAGLGAIWIDPEWVARLVPALTPHLDGIQQQTPMAIGLIGALFALHALGLLDDRRPMPAWPKFTLMFVVATAIVVCFDVRLLTLLDAYVGGPWLSIALTVLWLVAVTNAMNFMDNMDGLSAGVGAIASALFLITALLINMQWFVGAMLALLLGALCGFLVFNLPRRGGATIFMGDGGSLVVGFLLAFLTVRTTYLSTALLLLPVTSGDFDPALVEAAWWERFDAWIPLFMPLCILAVPLYDMASVVVIRLSQGKSPFVGDRQHFSHRLLAAGLSVPRTLAVICGCTAITGISGIMLSVATGWQAILIGIQVLLVLSVIGLYEHGKGWPLAQSTNPDRQGGAA